MRKPLAILILTLSVSGCVTATPSAPEAPPIDGATICVETRDERAEHASTLANTADVTALVTGAALIAALDAACDQSPSVGG